MEPVRVPYEIQGRVGPMHGLFIFTRRHYSANIRYQAAAGPVDNANGNAGRYIADGRRIVFTQWVQSHVRADGAQQLVLSRQGTIEATNYRIEDKWRML